jgi:hypothetical protein
MVQENSLDVAIAGWLRDLGITSLCQWDLLVFLYQHQTSLLSTNHFARLLGYATESVLSAMDALETLGLVGRSRVSQGARLYQFMRPLTPPRDEAFARLLALASQRAGRSRLAGQLPRDDRPPVEGRQAARRFRVQGRQVRPAARPQSQKDAPRKVTWLKAI